MKSSHKLTLAVALALGLAACGQKEETKKAEATAPAAPAGTTVTIAHAGPLTGSIAHLGKDDENGVALAVAQANDKKITIDGKPVTFKMMSEDDQADPKVGTTVAQKLVDAKVAAVVGHLNSGVSIPASEIYSKAGIPMISGSATNPQLTERGMKTVFRTVGRDDQQGPAIAAYIAHELKAKKVALIDDKTAYGEGLANEVEKTLKADKVNVVSRERTTDKETDFKAILTKIKAKNPDVVFHGGMDATGGPLLKQARELGIKAVFAFGDGACTDEMGKLAGAAAEGMVCSQAGLPREAADPEFVKAFNAKFGEIKQYAPYFYDATRAVIEAMKKANSTDPAKFTPELFNISFQGATGTVAFDAKGDRKDAEMTIFKFQNGKVVPISIVKGGKATPFDANAAAASAPAAGAAAPAPGAAPGSTTPAMAPSDSTKADTKAADTQKTDAKK
jgi:branched-chain amino acid transport system substrate-binding protein